MLLRTEERTESDPIAADLDLRPSPRAIITSRTSPPLRSSLIANRCAHNAIQLSRARRAPKALSVAETETPIESAHFMRPLIVPV